jgi:hypothetical protein
MPPLRYKSSPAFFQSGRKFSLIARSYRVFMRCHKCGFFIGGPATGRRVYDLDPERLHPKNWQCSTLHPIVHLTSTSCRKCRLERPASGRVTQPVFLIADDSLDLKSSLISKQESSIW